MARGKAKVKDEHIGKVKVGRNRWVSRQRAWQIRMKEEGKCLRCGGKLKKGSSRYCEVHSQAARDRATRRRQERAKDRAKALAKSPKPSKVAA